jgi:disulfide oxidoreductase YuzD
MNAAWTNLSLKKRYIPKEKYICTYVDITQKNKYSLKNIWIVSIYGYKNMFTHVLRT